MSSETVLGVLSLRHGRHARVLPPTPPATLRLLEVGRVKALGEPTVDRREQLVRFGPLALPLPETTETHRGAQLPGFGLLAAGKSEGLVETGFGLRWRPGWPGVAAAHPGGDAPPPHVPPRVGLQAPPGLSQQMQPSVTWPTCPAASASRTRPNGRDNACPVAQTAAMP